MEEWRPVLFGSAASVTVMIAALGGAFMMVDQSPKPPLPVVVTAKPAWDAAALRAPDAPASSVREPEMPAGPAAPATDPERSLAAMTPAPRPPAPAPKQSRPVRREAQRPPVTAVSLPRTEPRPQQVAIRVPPRPKPEIRTEGMLTPSLVRRIHASLRLTSEQEPLWPPIEQALRQIGAQQAAMVLAGQDPKEAFGLGAAMRMYFVSRALLGSLREDQRAAVRVQARNLGFGNFAAQI